MEVSITRYDPVAAIFRHVLVALHGINELAGTVTPSSLRSTPQIQHPPPSNRHSVHSHGLAERQCSHNDIGVCRVKDFEAFRIREEVGLLGWRCDQRSVGSKESI